MNGVLPYWTETIMSAIRSHKKVIITAHGNSLRALIQYVGHLADDEVTQLDIPTGVPWVYELDENLTGCGIIIWNKKHYGCGLVILV
jgi:2,3-bisphosphoglycerate-dependent phosphoglycerate mutase